MEKSRFDAYIRRFNAEDPTVFDEYLAPDMKMLNGSLVFTGVAGMRDHYENKMWPFFRESLTVERFVSSDSVLAVKMWTHFEARGDAVTVFGPVVKGETFDFRGLILYDILDGRFTTITVAYNSFTHTKADGRVVEMGIPH